jgi:F-type H+-transporting ATPase subunit b
MEDLTVLPEGQQQALRSAIAENNVKISVRSAFPMRQHQREVLETALNDLLRQKANYEFIQDTSLLAGVCITIGPWVLRANLSDEIGFFTEGIRHVD